MLLIGGVGTALYTFTLLATVVVEGGLHLRLRTAADPAHARRTRGPLHHLRLRPHRQHHRRGVPPPGRAVRRRRARPRARARGDRCAACWPSRPTPAARRCSRRARHRPRARASSPRSAPTPRTSTPCSPRACCAPDLFIVGARRDRRCRAQAAAGRRQPRASRRTRSAPSQMAQTALRPAVVDFVQLATSSGNLELAMEQVQDRDRRPRWPASRSSTPTCASASA